MIVTTICSKENELYAKMSEKIGKAFEVISKVLANTPEDGRYEVDGDDMYYMVQSYDTKSPQEARFESHREYIDVQAVISGEEIIRFESAGRLPTSEEYTYDCEFYNMNKEYDSVRLRRGEIAIIFTNELHAPCIRPDGANAAVRKLVIKIKAN